MTYDQRICSFPSSDRVSLLTLDGRVVTPFRFGTYAEGILQRTRGQCDLFYRKRSNTFFLTITVDVPEPTSNKTNDYLGVDLGIITLAATSDGEFLNHSTGPKHAHINQVRARYSRFRRKLQKNGTKSCKRLLRKRSGRERRFSRDVNHCLSKAIVQTAKGTRRGSRSKTSSTSANAPGKRFPNASGECCTVGRSFNFAPSLPTRRPWRVCRLSMSIRPIPARPVAVAGIVSKQTEKLNPSSFADRAGSLLMPI